MSQQVVCYSHHNY